MGHDTANQTDTDPPPQHDKRHHFAQIGRNLCWGGAALLLVVGALALVLSSCHPPRRYGGLGPRHIPPSFPSRQDVQVRLFHDIERVTISTASLCRWKSGSESGWKDKTYRTNRTVSADSGALKVDGRAIGSDTLFIHPSDDLFEIKGRNYRGTLTVSRTDDSRLVLMESLPLEDYVRSVVPSEMPSHWPMAALKAQAITARTFARHRMAARKGRRWLSRLDMAYGGTYEESSLTDAAVRQTQGQILFWRHRPLPAFFHSTCGGHTVSAESVFGDYDIPPLQGTTCRWCKSSPYYRWESTITSESLSHKLRERGIDEINRIKVDGRGKFERVTELIVNKTKRIPAADFRLTVGSRTIKSTWFSIESTETEYNFRGRGWGHGVGLCQYGARGMAEEGYSWQKILHHYFPGARLEITQSDTH
jgi:stage II sporulation protein D